MLDVLMSHGLCLLGYTEQCVHGMGHAISHISTQYVWILSII